MDRYKWIKDAKSSKRAKDVRDSITLQSPDGTVFEISVNDKGVLKTKIASKGAA